MAKYVARCTEVQLNQFGQAIRDFDHAVFFNPNGAEAYYNRGVIYKRLGEKRKALNSFEKFIFYATNPLWIQSARHEISELSKKQ